eukprot:scaffold1730_cov35-Tisochrysis_lutea.AAC.6
MSDRAKLLGKSVRSDDPSSSNTSIQAVQDQVDGVTRIMCDNLQRMLERDESLLALAKKSESTARSAGAFHTKARGARRGLQLQLYKTNAVIALLATLILLLAWWSGFLGSRNGDEPEPSSEPFPVLPDLNSTTRHG